MTCANPAAGLCTAVAAAIPNLIDFDSATAPSPFVSGAATFSFSPGNVSPFVTGSVSGQYAAPPNDQTRYLSIGSPGRAGSVIIDFSMPINYYGLYFASADAYNTFAFYETGNDITPLISFTGTQLSTALPGDQSTGQYINFYINGGTVSRIVLSSTQAALETDNHSYVRALGNDPSQVPEPATMGLMGGALTGIALVLRRRNRKVFCGAAW